MYSRNVVDSGGTDSTVLLGGYGCFVSLRHQWSEAVAHCNLALATAVPRCHRHSLRNVDGIQQNNTALASSEPRCARHLCKCPLVLV